MSDILIQKFGLAGHITLNRPAALNALTWDMCLKIEEAIDGWRDDPKIKLVTIDAKGDRAFCSGGDIAEMYATAKRGDYDYGRRFWRDEYRLNEKLASYPKPVVTFLQGFTMGGGVGVGCHGSHRVVCGTSQIAMPECSIGLVPDVGGSLLLARAPGHCGTYLGLTGDRMDAGDAIYAGFADHFVPEADWDDLKSRFCASGVIEIPIHPAPQSRLQGWRAQIDTIFDQSDLPAIYHALDDSPAAQRARKLMDRNAPLAMSFTVELIKAIKATPDIRAALAYEFRYTYRAGAQGDFVEGIRAAIIDRDKTPRWQHASWADVTNDDIMHMTAALGADALQWEDAQ